MTCDTTTENRAPDGFVLEADDAYRESHLLLNLYLNAAQPARDNDRREVDPSDTSLAAILQSAPSIRGGVFVAALRRISWIVRHVSGASYIAPLGELIRKLVAKRVILTLPQLEDCLEIAKPDTRTFWNVISWAQIVGIAERSATECELSERCRRLMKEYRDRLEGMASNAQMRDLIARLDRILTPDSVGASGSLKLEAGEAWSEAAIAAIDAMSEGRRAAWVRLLSHCQTATGSTPSAQWADVSQALSRPSARGSDRSPHHLAIWQRQESSQRHLSRRPARRERRQTD